MKVTHTTTNSAARMTLTGLFAAMIALMTAYICHIPYGANGGIFILVTRSFILQPYFFQDLMHLPRQLLEADLQIFSQHQCGRRLRSSLKC